MLREVVAGLQEVKEEVGCLAKEVGKDTLRV